MTLAMAKSTNDFVGFTLNVRLMVDMSLCGPASYRDSLSSAKKQLAAGELIYIALCY